MKKLNKILVFMVVIGIVSCVSLCIAGSVRFLNFTGTGNIASSIAPGVAWHLNEVRLHLSRNGTSGNFTITSDAGEGAAYDTVYDTQDLSSLSDYVKTFDPPLQFRSGDEVDLAWTNAATITYGIEAVFGPSY